jgi:integrase
MVARSNWRSKANETNTMSVFKNGRFYHYEFQLHGRRRRGSARTASKPQAIAEERRQRERLEKSYGQILEEEARDQQRKSIQLAADEFLKDYRTKHLSPTYAEYALGHVSSLLGGSLVVEITPKVVKRYQADRLKEKAGPKTINDEVQLLLRLCGEQGALIRATLRRDKALKLALPASPGRPYSAEEQERMLVAAFESTRAARLACERQVRGEKPAKGDKQGGSPSIYPALVVALNCGMRDAEIRQLRWSQIDFTKLMLTVGRAKTEAGAGRTIPLNGTLLDALLEHAKWYMKRFGDQKPEWFVFPGGGRFPSNPTVGITTLKTAWTSIRNKAGVTGRWHDNRHTLITELAESGAGDETIMAIAGHVSRQMLSRYAHIRTEAKRGALEDVDRKRMAARARSRENRQTQAAAEALAEAQIQ